MDAHALTVARELVPVIARLRDDTERDRCLAQPIVERLRETRLCRLAVPKALGGLELPLPDVLDVYEALGAAEASVAWIVWNSALPCLFGRILAPAVRAELFRDPTWLYAVSTRPTGRASAERDGYRLSGRWSLVSGCQLAEWIALMCVVEEDGTPRMVGPGTPEIRIAFVRRGDYEILDTWYAGGLRGTGSHDVVVHDRHVPQASTALPDDPSALDGPLGRIPIISTMALGYAAQVLGVARSAVDTLVALTRTKASPDPWRPGLGDRPAVHALIAEHDAALAAARAYAWSCAGRLWGAASAEGAVSIDDITAAWTSAHHAVGAARHAVEAAYAAAGTSALYTTCPLERAHRDLHAMLRHIVAQPLWLEDAGRVKLGMPPTNPLYAL